MSAHATFRSHDYASASKPGQLTLGAAPISQSARIYPIPASRAVLLGPYIVIWSD